MKKTNKFAVIITAVLAGLCLASCNWSDENPFADASGNNPESAASKTYKKYTVTTTKDVVAGDFAFVLQVDNTGSQDANGLKVDVTDFEMEVKVGNEAPFTYSNALIQMIPNEYGNPAFAKTDKRFVLDAEKAIPSGTTISVQVKKATISKPELESSIIYVFNEDGVAGWAQYVANSDNYKPIFVE